MRRPSRTLAVIAILTAGVICSFPLLAEQRRPESYTELGEAAARGEILPLELGGPSSGRAGNSRGTASLNYFTDRATFRAAAPNLQSFEDFEEGGVTTGEVANCNEPLDESSNDACFVPGDILPGLSIASSSGGGLVLLGSSFSSLNNPSKVVGANFFLDATSVDFPGGVPAAGMDIYVNLTSDTLDIRIYGAGSTLLGTTTLDTTNSGQFFGVVSDAEPITAIDINSQTAAGELVDDVEYPVELTSFSVE